MIDAAEPRPLTEERLEILRLVENQTVTAEEASRLLEALDRSDRADQFTVPFGPGFLPSPLAPARGGRSVRIRITNTEDDETRFNLVLPHPLLDAGLKMAKRFAPDQMLEAKEIRDTIDEGFMGPILDIVEGNQRVEIILEGAAPLSRRDRRDLRRAERGDR